MNFIYPIKAILICFTILPAPADVDRMSGRTAAAPPAVISVNVLGQVKRPGVYRIAGPGSLTEAIVAAGGWTERGNLKKITVVRGPAGEVPTLTEHDVNAILKGTATSPTLEERDTIFVPEKLF